MKRAIALVAALLAAGCGGTQKITEGEARAAMPGTSQAQLGMPSSSAQALTAAPDGSALDAGTARYARRTRAMAGAVNAGVLWVLGSVEVVVSFAPTSCDGDTCTWGPASGPLDPNDWKLTVTKLEAQHYAWALSARAKNDGTASFTPFVSGEAFTTGTRYVGHGTFTVDFDAARAGRLDDASVGKVTATYDNTGSPKVVGVQFLGTRDVDHPDQTVNAAYQFTTSASGGELQIAARNLSTQGTLAFRSRWEATGAGRADANAAQGANQWSESQCWGPATGVPAFASVFESTGGIPQGGNEAACDFTTAAAPDIQLP